MTHEPTPLFQLSPDLRLRTLSDVVEVVPYLIGFHPTSSLVVLGRRRGSARVRCVLCGPLDAPDGVHRQLVRRLAAEAVSQAFLIGYGPTRGTPEPGRYRGLADRLRRGCEHHGIGLDDFLYVHDGRMWSVLCDDGTCCPSEGRPVTAPGVSQIAAAAAYAGVPVIPSRAELFALLAPDPVVNVATAAEFDDAHRQYLAARTDGDLGRWHAARMGEWDAVLAEGRFDQAPGLPTATLGYSLFDLCVRDHVCSWAADDRRTAALRLLLVLIRRTPDVLAAPLLSTAAWLAWACGDRALACVAVERATDQDPDYSFAQIISEGLRTGLGGDHVVRIAATLVGGSPQQAVPTAVAGMEGGHVLQRRAPDTAPADQHPDDAGDMS